MKVCPSCGLENPSHAECCAECDADLSDVRPGRPMQQGPAKGHQQSQQPDYQPRSYQEQPPLPKKRHTLRNILIVLGVLVGVPAIIICVFVLAGVIGIGTEIAENLTDNPVGRFLTEGVTPDALLRKWGESADLGSLRVTVSAPVDDTANLGETERLFLEAGKKVVYCLVTIEKTGSTSYGYNVLSFTMYDSTGMRYDAFGVSTKPSLSTGDLLPGRTVAGAAAFSLPTASAPAYLDFAPGVLDSIAASWGR